jgi:hypothetical protein
MRLNTVAFFALIAVPAAQVWADTLLHESRLYIWSGHFPSHSIAVSIPIDQKGLDPWSVRCCNSEKGPLIGSPIAPHLLLSLGRWNVCFRGIAENFCSLWGLPLLTRSGPWTGRRGVILSHTTPGQYAILKTGAKGLRDRMRRRDFITLLGGPPALTMLCRARPTSATGDATRME